MHSLEDTKRAVAAHNVARFVISRMEACEVIQNTVLAINEIRPDLDEICHATYMLARMLMCLTHIVGHVIDIDMPHDCDADPRE